MSDSSLLYNNFIGIDIGKIEFYITVHQSNKASIYLNSPEGIAKFYQEYQDQLSGGLVVLETTGGYELEVINYLQANNIAVHRAHAKQVKNFIKSYAINGKSDKIDAKALALYAFERSDTLKLYELSKYIRLKELSERRNDLIKMRTQELNRKQSPGMKAMQSSFDKILLVFNEQVTFLESEMQEIIDNNPELLAKFKAICEIPGIKSITARSLLAAMPELGSLNQKQIASLAGLAPHPKQSGTKEGYRRTSGGRREIKQILYMAALSSSRSKGKYGKYYRDLVARGKKPIVGLVALMRKMIVIANSKIKEALASDAKIEIA